MTEGENNVTVGYIEDPDKKKHREYGFYLDSLLIDLAQGKPIPPSVPWMALWIRLCKGAIFTRNKELLDDLFAVRLIAKEAPCNKAFDLLRMAIGS